MNGLPEASIAIVIVSYDSGLWLESLLPYLTSHIPAGEIVVVDNASLDGSADIAKRYGCQCLENADNLGFGVAANQGLDRLHRNSRAGWFLVLNPDIKPTCDYAIARILEQLTEMNPRTIPVPRLKRDGLSRLNVHPYLRPSIALRLAVTGRPSKPSDDAVTLKSHYLIGSFLLLHRSIWKDVQGFDPSFFLYGEDADLSYRLSFLKLAGLAELETHFYHFGNPAPWTLPSRQRALLVGGIKRCNQRCIGRNAAGLSSFVLGAGALVRAARSLFHGPMKRVGAELDLVRLWWS